MFVKCPRAYSGIATAPVNSPVFTNINCRFAKEATNTTISWNFGRTRHCAHNPHSFYALTIFEGVGLGRGVWPHSPLTTQLCQQSASATVVRVMSIKC